ncbi:hypothetical protein HHI36_019417 [Cryptolaemus montrouzieri]|uniref:UNC93-like protein MFSD11 n=1 Tax=Cryptolaemus montrouzieri TaxID=559131 RepID=A0ABD2P3I6_9CUCU
MYILCKFPVLVEGLKLKENAFTGIGFLCLILIHATFAATILFTPPFVSITGPKIVMVIGCATHILFIVSMIHPFPVVISVGSVLVGIGSAFLWTGQGNYLVRNSTEKNISMNCALFWTILQASVLFGSIFVYFRFYDVSFIDDKLRLSVVWLLLGLSGTSFLIFLMIPNCVNEDALSGPCGTRPDILQVLIGIGNSLQSVYILLLCSPFFFLGAAIIFFIVTYGVVIGHTTHLERPKQLAPLAGVFIGLGEITGGGALLIFGAYNSKSRRSAIVIFGCVLFILAQILIFINLPNEAPFGDTDDFSIIEPSAVLVIGSAFMLGLADTCFNTQIMAALGSNYPKNSASVFAVFKFVQTIGAVVALAYSALVILYGIITILIGLSLFTTISYVVSEGLQVDETKIFAYKKKEKKNFESGEGFEPSLEPKNYSLPATPNVTPPLTDAPTPTSDSPRTRSPPLIRPQTPPSPPTRIVDNTPPPPPSPEIEPVGLQESNEARRTHRNILRRLFSQPDTVESDEDMPFLPTPSRYPPTSVRPATPPKTSPPEIQTPAKEITPPSSTTIPVPTPNTSKLPRQRKGRKLLKKLISGPQEMQDSLSEKSEGSTEIKKRRRRKGPKTRSDDEGSVTSSMKERGSTPKKGILRNSAEEKVSPSSVRPRTPKLI